MSKLVKSLKGVEILRRKNIKVIPFTLAVAQVIGSPDKNTREVKVIKMEQNEYLKMYFNKSFKFLTEDEGNKTKVGDIVLIKRLTKPQSQEKLFGVEKVLFQVDNIIDPMTGRSNQHESDILTEHMKKLTTNQQPILQ
jgi:ribosomal protein S17